MKNGGNLCGWEPDEAWLSVAAETLTDWENWNAMVPLLMETAMAHRKRGNQRDVSDRNGTQITPVEKEENRTAPRANRVEMALSRNLEKAESVETRETFGQDQRECRDGESSQEIAKQAFQLELDCKRRKSRICSRKILPRPLLDSGRPGGVNPIRETPLCRAVEKPENGCAGGMLISPEKLENVLKKLKNGKGSPDQIFARCSKIIASRMFGEAGKIVVADVLGYEFPGRLAVLVDGDGSESGGCNVIDQVQTDSWIVCDAKSLGLRMAQVTSSTKIRECANGICAEDACRCWTVCAVESGRTVSREWQREILWWYSWT